LVTAGATVEGYASNQEVSIRYKIDLPPGEGPFPAVVYGPGSGNVPADHRVVTRHAKRLTELGFAVVRYDKRGTGASEGELLSLSTANSDSVVSTLAMDMLAVLRSARLNPAVDPEQLGLFGASQANWYMPIVAASATDIRFMVVLTGGVIPVGPNNYWEQLVFVEDRDPFSSETYSRWSAYDGPQGFDQRPFIRRLGIPMLYLLGEEDRGVPFRIVVEMIEQLQAEGVDLTLKGYPGSGHLLSGSDFWDDLREWLESNGMTHAPVPATVTTPTDAG